MSSDDHASSEEMQAWAKYNPNHNGFAYPLHDVGLSMAPVAVRLAWAQEALEAGHDVNKLHHRMGRPLQTAIDEPHNRDDRTGARLGRCENIDVVKWLLDHGADPRLRNSWGQTAMDDAWVMSRLGREKDNRTEDDDMVADFLDQARDMMVQVARKLEEKEAKEKGVLYRAKDFFGVGRDPMDDMCPFCKFGYLGHTKGQPLKNCKYCREEKALNWHYAKRSSKEIYRFQSYEQREI
ncbi:hypothetical protein GGR53DRAFT_502024 [Hypoxylon sp. FL1150]|nr:hypothetical protein GGR53DRAFT_502024 [Hypoxylon sp. FL1150]